ncbi:MAG TPA: LLM class flavin-dependent oxidoreductase [Candidatus Eisenbacteria bacterium]|nr:LLM class flavin-dependent oxidoreductase [Candidatus Eisenbacteria bacterium]
MKAWTGLPIGVALGSVGATADWWLESARRLDEVGYRGVWCWDHFMGRGDPTVPVLEQWTILAAASGVTERIGLGTFVTNVMNRHPAVVARMASTLQAASGGRLTLGIGIGGFPGEHEAYGIPFPAVRERVERLEEAVGVIRALWTGGPVSREGRYYRLHEAHAHPPPDPPPAILIGAGSRAGVRLAARIGDGWAAEKPDFERFLPAYLEALDVERRDRSLMRIALGFTGGRSGQDALTASPWVAAPRDEWEQWQAAGADEIIVTARTPADVDGLVAAVDRW